MKDVFEWAINRNNAINNIAINTYDVRYRVSTIARCKNNECANYIAYERQIETKL